ncbi:MAG: hypothetical protein CVU56_16660 [Deltaproteobacteria bacterium HGW-Deltaproteobacteria-14]|nr:MAG: hypothetical protein CVU56_16660 [Deltaproteobacteria bacterium HGW-Deltaproteobacteria-14]
MIRLDRVELLHWDIQPHQMLPLARGVTMLTGENGSGKTSVLDAIKVALGATHLGGERTVDHYLLRQAQPIAMVRLLVDNRPDPGSRRRPFDPLGEQSDDTVTLAVVFEQDDETHYRRSYYILDGDAVPPPLATSRPGAPARSRRDAPRLLSNRDYRERLAKVGVGQQYLKLLCLPQGRIASLCQSDGARLFDELFDVIGGRQALETWEERLRELTERQREHATTDGELATRTRDLELLRQRVRRHEDWLALRDRVATLDRAIPHQHVEDARARVAALSQDVERTSRDRDDADARLRDAEPTARPSTRASTPTARPSPPSARRSRRPTPSTAASAPSSSASRPCETPPPTSSRSTPQPSTPSARPPRRPSPPGSRCTRAAPRPAAATPRSSAAC